MTGPLAVRQLLAGRDFASADRVASQMANFAYALVDETARRALLVDPAYAPRELVGLLELDGIAVTGVLLTHYHPDHAGGRLGSLGVAGIAELLEDRDLPVHVQRDELAWVAEATGVGTDALVAHDGGDLVKVGAGEVTLIHTPGHTPGSQCLLIEDAVLTGDTLFLDGCGRTDLPGGDPRKLYDSLFHRLGALPPTTLVLPGHHYSPERAATLAEVRARNPFLVAPDDLDAFVARMTA